MTELVVVSGKGGTGKTTIAASLAVLAGRVVIADCDVDAADLHILLAPEIERSEAFFAGHGAVVRDRECSGCGVCVAACRFGAIRQDGAVARINAMVCEGCGVCVQVCSEGAIGFPVRRCGDWFLSTTRVGPLVHARLEPGGENSGKLVTLVRREARRLAEEGGYSMIVADGPPGIGCPVIASLTGAPQVLAVTEPTVSGLHDLERLLELTTHFGVVTRVCVNRWDINPDLADSIEALAVSRGAAPIGRVRFDDTVVWAQLDGTTPVERGGCAGDDIEALWSELQREGGMSEPRSR